jgi:hypothetical protein
MNLLNSLARLLHLKRDRGLIFEAYGDSCGYAQFLGYLVTEPNRAAQPIGFVPMDVYSLRHPEDESHGAPLLSIFDKDRMRFTDPVEHRVRRRIAQRVASDHRLAAGGQHGHPEVVNLRGIRLENKDDRRGPILLGMSYLPASKMPRDFSPFEDWIGCYSFLKPDEGPLMFGVMDVEALRDWAPKKSGSSEVPIVPTPAKQLGQKAHEPTAA